MIETDIMGNKSESVPMEWFIPSGYPVQGYKWDGYLVGRPGVYQNYQPAELPQEPPFVINEQLQKVYVEKGDFIIQEEDGIHFTAYKPEVFWKKYSCAPVHGLGGDDD